MRGGEIDARTELDLRLRQSAEGGLAFDVAGQAIGMAVFGPRRRVLVIPSGTIERVAAMLESHGRIARGYLGLGLQPVALQGGEGSGAIVMSVDPQDQGQRVERLEKGSCAALLKMQRHGDGDRTKLLVHIRRAPQPSLPRDQISELLDKFGVASARRLRKFVAGNGFRFGKRVAWRGIISGPCGRVARDGCRDG
jgi:S1-C subfamily serine protease